MMEHTIKVKVNGETAAQVLTNHSMTVEEIMYCSGYDITDEQDCTKAVLDGVPGFYIDDNGTACFDIEAAEIVCGEESD